MTANWFRAKVKVNYLEFGTGIVNEIEANAFNADAFKSVKHLTITKMDLYVLKKGIFNGLESLAILNLKSASLIQSVDMGILDVLNHTLKELTIEGDIHAMRALPIESFTGSQQTLSLEFMRVRYALNRLTSKSFLSLAMIKYLDVAYCRIQYIEQGTFDPIIGTVKVLLLTGNELRKLPAGMLDLVPLRLEVFIFMGNEYSCDCTNIPYNFIIKVDCELSSDEADKLCISLLPTELRTTTSMTTNTPTTPILPLSSTNDHSSVQPTQAESTTTVLTSSSIQPTQTESTTSEVTVSPSVTVPTSSSPSPILIAQLKELESGRVILYLSDESKKKSTLIWFLTDEPGTTYSNEINCPRSQMYSRCSMTVMNLTKNSKYTFCVTDDLEETNEPSHCIEYTTRGSSYLQVWLETISETTIAVMVAMMCSLFILIGFIAFLYSKR